MKIAFIISDFPKLSETFILNQITGLIDRGHDVDIYANCSVKDLKIHSDVVSYNLLKRTYYFGITGSQLKIRLRAFKLSAINLLKNPSLVIRSWNKFAYDPHNVFMRTTLPQLITPFTDQPQYEIIHCHFGENGLKGLMLKQVGAIHGKLVTTFHGYDLSEYVDAFGKQVYSELFSLGSICFSISERMRQQLIQLGCDSDKVKVHRVGIDCNAFVFKPRQYHQNSAIRLITICRLVEKKGVEYAIRAVAKLTKSFPQIRYTIVGDGPLMEELKHLIEQLGVRSSVELVGWKERKEVIELLKAAHILLAPSVTSQNGDQEGIPVSIMEGMAMGLPVVSTVHSGIPELVEDGASGFLVKERDVDGLADKLKWLFDNPESWPKMGFSGREQIEKKHDIELLNDKLVEIYKSLV